MYKSARKPVKCPACGARAIARIIYDAPEDSASVAMDLREGRAVLGTCCFTGEAPLWQCTECWAYIGRGDKGGLESE